LKISACVYPVRRVKLSFTQTRRRLASLIVTLYPAVRATLEIQRSILSGTAPPTGRTARGRNGSLTQESLRWGRGMPARTSRSFRSQRTPHASSGPCGSARCLPLMMGGALEPRGSATQRLSRAARPPSRCSDRAGLASAVPGACLHKLHRYDERAR
jgi:hypothetical protein